jgi:hypothetical protein
VLNLFARYMLLNHRQLPPTLSAAGNHFLDRLVPVFCARWCIRIQCLSEPCHTAATLQSPLAHSLFGLLALLFQLLVDITGLPIRLGLQVRLLSPSAINGEQQNQCANNP